MKRIEEARKLHGWSQAEMAEKMGTSQQQVARYEKPNADVKASVLMTVSDVCGVSISWLLGITDDPKEATVSEDFDLTPDEWYLIRLFRSCTPKYQSLIIDTVASFRDSSKESAVGSKSYGKAVNE